MAYTIPDWLVQSLQAGTPSAVGGSASGGILQSPLVGAAAGPPPAQAPIVNTGQPQGNNAGRGLGNFAASMGNGNASQPMNRPPTAPTAPQPPSLNQSLGLIPKVMQTFGMGQPQNQTLPTNPSQAPNQHQGLIPKALQAFGIDPSSLGDNVNLGLQDLGSGGAMTGLFPGGI